MRASASWTKMSAATLTPLYTSGHVPSLSQPSAAEIFSGADSLSSRNQEMFVARQTSRAGGLEGVGNSRPFDGPRWTGSIPFRESWPHALSVTTEDEFTTGELKNTEANRSVRLPPVLANNIAQYAADVGDALASSQPRTLRRNTTDAATSATARASTKRAAAAASVASDLSDAEYDRLCHSEDRHCIFAPKTICVISRFPIYGVLRRFLRHLYAISLSRSGVPLERYISMFVSCIPMPPPGEDSKVICTFNGCVIPQCCYRSYERIFEEIFHNLLPSFCCLDGAFFTRNKLSVFEGSIVSRSRSTGAVVDYGR